MNSLSLIPINVPQWGIMVFAMSEEKPLKQLRLNLGLSQKEAADYLGIPLNTLQNYEQGQRIPSFWIEALLLDKLSDLKTSQTRVFSQKEGVYPLSELIQKIKTIVSPYGIPKVYLFGSYAKGLASEQSDVDLYLSSPVPGGKYYRLLEELVEGLHKNVDLLNPETIEPNSKIDLEIKKTGILIYER
jgi:predicted nucleotidyltransferase